MVKTCIITGFGINADDELAQAFKMAGSETSKIHIHDLISKPELLEDFDILSFPGGFSFGDHIGSGLVFANLIKSKLKDELDKFIEKGKLIIGICNGFQVIVKMGLLPNTNKNWDAEVSLIHNDSGVFEDSWVNLSFNKKSKCIWTEGLEDMDMPIRHGEGRFITKDENFLKHLKDNELIALKYNDRNPNGSEENIAGITDKTGQIFGLMPHPEAFIFPENHPKWKIKNISEGFGLRIFQNAVNYIKKA